MYVCAQYISLTSGCRGFTKYFLKIQCQPFHDINNHSNSEYSNGLDRPTMNAPTVTR